MFRSDVPIFTLKSVYSVCANLAGADFVQCMVRSDASIAKLKKFFPRLTRYGAMIKKPNCSSGTAKSVCSFFPPSGKLA